VLIFAFGAYLAATDHLWGKVWVDALAIIGVIALLGALVLTAVFFMSARPFN